LKLLLDEMWPPRVAEELRARSHDVEAVAGRAELRGLDDRAVFVAAQNEGRIIVTENVADFRPLAWEVLSRGESHVGLIFTSNRRFPRHDLRTAGRLVIALDRFLVTESSFSSSELWLT
jgi:predicted nuclease of predicted toxin-antitoxin system